jgi:carboxymethylenebutenolidase
VMQQEIDSLVPARDFTRRAFVRSAVGTGFAAAVLPVVAQTMIKTDSAGLTVGEVTIPVGDFKMPAYRAAPAGAPALPVVLVVSEIFGVHEHIADVARRFAKAGYLAIAPELFVRQGDAGSYGEIAKLIERGVAKTPDAQVMGDLDADRGLGQGARGDTSRWASPVSAGAAAHLDVRRAQPGGEGRRGLVRPPVARSYYPGDKTALDVAGASRRRCWACTVQPTPASRTTRSRRCATRSRRPATASRRSCSTPTRRTPSTPTTGPAIARSRPRTAGSAAWPG